MIHGRYSTLGYLADNLQTSVVGCHASYQRADAAYGFHVV